MLQVQVKLKRRSGVWVAKYRVGRRWVRVYGRWPSAAAATKAAVRQSSGGVPRGWVDAS